MFRKSTKSTLPSPSWTKGLKLFILAIAITSSVLSAPVSIEQVQNVTAIEDRAIGFSTVYTIISKAYEIYQMIQNERSKTAIAARGLLANVEFSGGTSLGVCYYGNGGGACSWLSNGHKGLGKCWKSGTNAMRSKSMKSGFRNNKIEVYANQQALCIDHLSFSYGPGNVHPHDEKIVVTGDMTYECGHPWTYNGQWTGDYQHKCMFIGNVEWLQFKNTYTFDVERMRTFSSNMAAGVHNDPSKGYDAMQDMCKGITSWKRDDLPGTNDKCGSFDETWQTSQQPMKRSADEDLITIKRVRISDEEHAANLKQNPNYVGRPPVGGYVEVHSSQ
ncbi:hypothetical protein BG011_005452 [Mortierella polycephala]|uniref:Uncharacterized protein n=1 Tax=Mortierella polycephala TaxID=41804 RepID=A0A9P6PXA2_9FUNG|nr:hypothetical protein BG011_005452 [Mortierella polycephala]